MDEDRYATVLVGVLKSRRDLRLALEEGWYRIPVRHLPARASTARFLAFYQPRSFGPAGGVIRYVAPIRAWEMVRRRDLLPDESDHPRAEELYYRVTLGTVQHLCPPIRVGRWKRFAFLITHWERLHRAQEVRELLHGSLWEERLWSALRQAGILS